MTCATGIPRQVQKEKHMGVFEKIFGTRSQREIKKIQPTVDKILALEDDYKALSEEALKAKTAEFKNGWIRGRRWTTSCRKPLLPFGKRPTGCWECAPTPFSSSAASCSIRGASPK